MASVERSLVQIVRTALLFVSVILLAGCSGEGSDSAIPLDPGPVARGRPIHVFASRSFGAIIDRLEVMFERDHPGLDLIVTYGSARPPLDADQVLVEMIENGVVLDALLTRDEDPVGRLSRQPLSVSAWAGGRLVLIRAPGSGLRLIDLSSGDCEVSIALDRTALGRATRDSLRRRGLWNDISDRIGLFDGPKAITTRIVSAQLPPCLGIVFESDARTSESPVRIAARLDPDGEPIEHVVGSFTSDGEMFAAWLQSPAVQSAVQRYGFVALFDARGADDSSPGGNR